MTSVIGPSTFEDAKVLSSPFASTSSLRTISTSSTVWGPGALTGKALKLLGEKSLDLLCNIIIRRRLASIRQTLEKNPHVFIRPVKKADCQLRDRIYGELKEICRGPYSLSLCRLAANILRDIVALITSSVSGPKPYTSFDGLKHASTPILTRTTLILSAPMHAQWATLLYRLQRREPLLFSDHDNGHDSVISVSRWAAASANEEAVKDRPSETPRLEDQPSTSNRSIRIAVTVEVKRTYSSAPTSEEDYARFIKLSSFRNRLFRAIHSQRRSSGRTRSQQDQIPTSTTNSSQTYGPSPTYPNLNISQNMTTSALYEPKILVLGAGGVGKSTLIKQQILTLPGYSGWHNPLDSASREIIVNNTITSMKSILLEVSSSRPSHSGLLLDAKRTVIELSWPNYHKAGDEASMSLSSKQLSKVGNAIQTLWQDPTIREVARSKKASLLDELFAAPDSLEYFCTNAARIFSPSYVPSPEDALRSRVCTTGMCEIVLKSKSPNENQSFSPNFAWHFIDTGGERSERRKWEYFYEGAATIMFVVALSDYNKVMYEDGSMTRLDDSLQLFKSIVDSPRFMNTLITLIFNKEDVFAHELKNCPLNEYMPSFRGKSYIDARQYIEDQFTGLVKDKGRLKARLRIHYTTAVEEGTMLQKSILIRNQITEYYTNLQRERRA